MSKELINEITKMKSFFNYKRGVVISENFGDGLTGTNEILKQTKFECLLNGLKKQYKVKFGDSDKNDVLIYITDKTYWSFTTDGRWSDNSTQGTWKCNIPPLVPGFTIKSNSGYIYDSSVGDWKEDVSNIKIDDKQKNKKNTDNQKNKTDNQQTKTNTQKTIFDIVQSEKNPTTGKNYVWKEVRHAYQLEKQPTTPEGDIKTNTQLQKDWLAGWRPGQQKQVTVNNQPAQKIQISNEPGKDEDDATNEPGKDEDDVQNQGPQIKIPQQVAQYQGQQQTFANVEPNDYYTSLSDAGLIKGEGGNKVRYRGPELSKDQQDKLTQAMTNLGYEFYRKGNDKRLVYRKK
jgi:hypothetical protein